VVTTIPIIAQVHGSNHHTNLSAFKGVIVYHVYLNITRQ